MQIACAVVLVTCGLSESTLFFHITPQTGRFSGNNVVDHKIFFFWGGGAFSKILSEIFLILRGTERVIIINLHMYQV
jgi:hypothetical protein